MRTRGLKIGLLIFAALTSLYTGEVLATQTLATVATAITATFGSIAQLITAIAYVGGMGFALGAVLKFKQHKDNPQQIPIGTPIALIFVAASLIFLPTIFSVAGQTIFGGEQAAGGPTGISTFS